MTFGQQVLSTLIGTGSGFLFAIALFWIKERAKRTSDEQTLVKNLHYEFAYNRNLFEKYVKQISEAIETINAGGRNAYISIEYNLVASYFSIQFYRSGLCAKRLHYEDMKRWNDVLTNHSQGAETHVMESLEKWRAEDIEQDKVVTTLKHERKQLEYAIEMIDYLKERIK